jgi:hypothetical protein
MYEMEGPRSSAGARIADLSATGSVEPCHLREPFRRLRSPGAGCSGADSGTEPLLVT